MLRQFKKKYAIRLNYLSFLAMLIIPFLLYLAVMADSVLAINLLLALLGLSMLMIIFVG